MKRNGSVLWLIVQINLLFAALSALTAGSAVASAEPVNRAREAEFATQTSIILIGGDQLEELETLIRELLARDGVHCEFSRARSFSTDELFDDTVSSRRVVVFVHVEAMELGVARLYFRGPFGKRYLLRRLQLPNGLDEVGRELIGQVVESSVLALLNSSAGMNRRQAQTQLLREQPTQSVEATNTPSPPRPLDGRQASASPILWIHARYALTYGGSELGLSHGPGAELAIGSKTRPWLRGRIAAEYSLARRLPTEDVAVEVQNSSLRLSLDGVIAVTEFQSVVTSLGAGMDFTRIVPKRTQSDVIPSEPRAHFDPLIRPELRYEITQGVVTLALAGFTDIAVSNTHYDLLERGERTTLTRPWRLRLGAAASAGIHW